MAFKRSGVRSPSAPPKDINGLTGIGKPILLIVITPGSVQQAIAC